MTKSIENFKSKLEIDKHKLDDCIEKQAAIFYEIAEQTSLTSAQKDALKYDLDNITSAIYLDIRQEAVEKSRKVTESLLQNEVEQVQEYQEAKEAYLEAKAEADNWVALKESFTQRGYMLRDLANLWVSGYFAEISVKDTAHTDDIKHEKRRQQMSKERLPLRRRIEPL